MDSYEKLLIAGFSLLVLGVITILGTVTRAELRETRRQCHLLYSIAKTKQDSLTVQIAIDKCKPTE